MRKSIVVGGGLRALTEREILTLGSALLNDYSKFILASTEVVENLLKVNIYGGLGLGSVGDGINENIETAKAGQVEIGKLVDDIKTAVKTEGWSEAFAHMRELIDELSDLTTVLSVLQTDYHTTNVRFQKWRILSLQ